MVRKNPACHEVVHSYPDDRGRVRALSRIGEDRLIRACLSLLRSLVSLEVLDLSFVLDCLGLRIKGPEIAVFTGLGILGAGIDPVFP